jgi:hypothetical protein
MLYFTTPFDRAGENAPSRPNQSGRLSKYIRSIETIVMEIDEVLAMGQSVRLKRQQLREMRSMESKGWEKIVHAAQALMDTRKIPSCDSPKRLQDIDQKLKVLSEATKQNEEDRGKRIRWQQDLEAQLQKEQTKMYTAMTKIYVSSFVHLPLCPESDAHQATPHSQSLLPDYYDAVGNMAIESERLHELEVEHYHNVRVRELKGEILGHTQPPDQFMQPFFRERGAIIERYLTAKEEVRKIRENCFCRENTCDIPENARSYRQENWTLIREPAVNKGLNNLRENLALIPDLALNKGLGNLQRDYGLYHTELWAIQSMKRGLNKHQKGLYKALLLPLFPLTILAQNPGRIVTMATYASGTITGGTSLLLVQIPRDASFSIQDQLL